MTVAHDQDALSLQVGKNPPVRLEHWEDDTFHAKGPLEACPWADWLMRFAPEDGRAAAVDVEGIGWKDPFPRMRRVSTDSP